MLMADFVTAVKYKLPIKVIVIKNNTLGQIKWEQIIQTTGREVLHLAQVVSMATKR